MRVTITLDDALAADIRRVAETNGKSVSAVISEALRAHLDTRAIPATVQPFRLVTVKGVGPRPGVDLSKLKAIDELEDIERWT
jgi:hypothetical protein